MNVRWITGVVLIGVLACAQGASGSRREPFNNDKEKTSYALGVSIARQMKTRAIEVDAAALARGFQDVLSNGKSLLTDDEVRAAVAAVQKDYTAKIAALKKEQMRARREAALANNPERATQIVVSYKLDPRLATGTYGSFDRWVSPPTYTQVGDAKMCKVTARARGLDAGGAPTAVHPKWTASDEHMVSITPTEGSDVTLLVQRPGASRVHVTSEGLSKDLEIKAAYQNSVLQVEITAR
jgi:hypothetical protein